MTGRRTLVALLRFLTIVALISVSTFGSVTAQSAAGSAQALQARVAPQRARGRMSRTPRQLSQADIQRLEAAEAHTHLPGPRTPVGTGPSRLAPAPTVPQTAVRRASPLASPTDLTVFRNMDLGSAAPSGFTSVVNEPSTASNQDIVFESFNWSAALSTDDGNTFANVDPFTFFPSAHAGFCCDQVVLYEPTRNVMLWLLQYINDSTGNTLRLAVSNSRANLIAGSWYYYDFSPSGLTYTGQAADDWFDYPHMAFGANNVYITINIFTVGGSWRGTVIFRMPLTPISTGAGFSYDYFVSTSNFNFTPVQGAGALTTMYWASHNSTTSLRVFNWTEGSGSIFWDDVTHTSYPAPFPYSCPAPNTVNWCGRAGDRVMTGWAAGGVLGFMWNAGQGVGGFGTFTWPYIHVVRLNQSTRALLSEPIIFSGSNVWIYPSIGVNARGDIAGPAYWGDSTSNHPTCNGLIWDDQTSGFWSTFFIRASSNDPTTANRWGDYTSSRTDMSPYQYPGFQWVGSCETLQGGGANSNARPQFVRWGRRRDRIATAGVYNPATGVFYLRNSNTTGSADVTFPYGPGGLGWRPMSGHWTGGLMDTAGLYNPATSTFYLRNSNSTGFADITFAYGPGGAGWIPLMGDWNGDGVDSIGLYNPATSTFYLRNSNSSGFADITFAYGPGGAGWIPVVGDWNGDGVDTIGLYDPTTSAFFLRNTNSTGFADMTFAYGPGGAGWTPLVGNWNGSGVSTIGLYNPTTATFYLRYTNNTGVADRTYSYGLGGAGWVPVPRDFDSH